MCVVHAAACIAQWWACDKGCEWSGLICRQRRYYSRLGNRPDCVVQEEGAIYYTFPSDSFALLPVAPHLFPRYYFQDNQACQSACYLRRLTGCCLSAGGILSPASSSAFSSSTSPCVNSTTTKMSDPSPRSQRNDPIPLPAGGIASCITGGLQ